MTIRITVTQDEQSSTHDVFLDTVANSDAGDIVTTTTKLTRDPHTAYIHEHQKIVVREQRKE